MRGTAHPDRLARVIDALLRRGWQHDGRQPMNPAKPGPRPQKVPDALL